MNKYRSEITTETKSNNLDYLIHPTFKNINRLFALSLKNCENDPMKDYFDKYCISLIKIKDFNVLIDNIPFLDQSVEKRSVLKTFGNVKK